MNRNQAGFLPARSESSDTVPGVDGHAVRAWFSDPVAIRHYARAAVGLGLWKAEATILPQVFAREARLLDIGCGAGRIALGLWRLGFADMVGVDFCPPMIAEAHILAEASRCPFTFEVGDATALRFADASFAGAVFGFNGLMQIPGRKHRCKALAELRRVVAVGGRLIFTTHDRDLERDRACWDQERARWSGGTQAAHLLEFGDRVLALPEGVVFMHLPDRAEILADLAATGWECEFDELRSRIANEPAPVREFSDECRFWIARA